MIKASFFGDLHTDPEIVRFIMAIQPGDYITDHYFDAPMHQVTISNDRENIEWAYKDFRDGVKNSSHEKSTPDPTRKTNATSTAEVFLKFPGEDGNTKVPDESKWPVANLAVGDIIMKNEKAYQVIYRQVTVWPGDPGYAELSIDVKKL